MTLDYKKENKAQIQVLEYLLIDVWKSRHFLNSHVLLVFIEYVWNIALVIFNQSYGRKKNYESRHFMFMLTLHFSMFVHQIWQYLSTTRIDWHRG